MAKVIEVFVKNTEVSVAAEHGVEFISAGHECTSKPVVRAVMEKTFSDADKKALELLMTLAKEAELKVRVHNVSTLRGRMMARFKGVYKTPTIIIENHRIEGAITKEELLSML